MAITINTNVPSLNAQRNLNQSQNALNTAMQRLSSGLRINSAKDDAAGLAISDRMTSQIRGLNQAARNANDGISLAQTAEGALQESTNILQRMRELAVQSANDTNSVSDRASLNDELIQLQEELDRIAETTEFNGRRLIDGSMNEHINKATFQVGANAGVNQTISFGIDSAIGADLSSDGTIISAPNGTPETGNAVTGNLSSGQLIVNGNDVGVVAHNAKLIAAAISDADSNVTATATNSQSLAFDNLVVDPSGNVQTGADVSGTAIVAGDLLINGFEITSEGDAGALADAINNATVGATAVGQANSSTTSGAFTAVADGTDYKLTVETRLGSFIIVDHSSGGGGVVAVDMTDQSVVDGLAAIGVTVTGDATTGWLFNTADGSNITVTESTSAGSEGFTAANWANTAETTYSNVVITGDNGTGVAISGNDAGTKSGLSNTTNTYQLDIDDGTTTTTINFDANAVGAKDGNATNYEIANAINSEGTYTASVNAETGKIDIAKADDDGANLSFTETLTGLAGNGFTSGSSTTYYGSLSLDSNEDIIITGTSQGLARAGLTGVGVTTTTIDEIDISTRDGATIAISSVDAAISQIDQIRGGLGAIQNRFESTIANLANVAENLSSARSRILDADIAQETSAMIKNNILQQAGVSILVQANQAPQMALSLLQ